MGKYLVLLSDRNTCMSLFGSAMCRPNSYYPCTIKYVTSVERQNWCPIRTSVTTTYCRSLRDTRQNRILVTSEHKLHRTVSACYVRQKDQYELPLSLSAGTVTSNGHRSRHRKQVWPTRTAITLMDKTKNEMNVRRHKGLCVLRQHLYLDSSFMRSLSFHSLLSK